MQPTRDRRRHQRRRRLDYGHWAAMAYWSAEEGAALLLKINPAAVSDPEFPHSAIFERFEKLEARAIRAHETSALPAKWPPIQFIDWAQRSGVSVPAILRAAVLKTTGKLQLDGRERVSVLALLISMAKAKYNYDPNDAKSSATKAIQNDVLLNGFNISDATVLKYLREGANLPSHQG